MIVSSKRQEPFIQRQAYRYENLMSSVGDRRLPNKLYFVESVLI